ncbi:MAG: hypothetical protein QM726_12765 [Chitinophagaceae bacterium]
MHYRQGFGRFGTQYPQKRISIWHIGFTKLFYMITQYEVPGYLLQILPANALQTGPANINMHIYKDMQSFTDYTRQAVTHHNYSVAKKCFLLAEKLYKLGDKTVRLTIENIFVYSFSSFIPENNIDRIILRNYIPAALYSIYMKQVNSCGC